MGKTTKRSLALSLLSVFLCTVMLVGVTFAWFTDSVTSRNNKITAGNLEARLLYSTDGTRWAEVNENTKVFNEDADWEPGHTEVVYLKVQNAGSLALKYKLGINVADEKPGVNTSGETFKLSDYIKFGVAEPDAAYTDREDAVDAVNSTAKPISEGYESAEKELQKDSESEMMALVVYMPDDVSNDANHNGDQKPSVDLGINMAATQMSSETDSFGNDYDKNAPLPIMVSTSDELAEAVQKGEDVKLTDNIDITKPLKVSQGYVNIDLDGHELKSTDDGINMIEAVGNGSVYVKDGTLTVSDDGNKGSVAVYAEGNSEVIIDNCQINCSGKWGYGLVTNGSKSKDTSIIVKNSDITYEKGYTCYFPAGDIILEDCNVKGAVIISGGNVIIDGGVYTADGFADQSKIWHKEDTINYMKNFATKDGSGHMGDSILIMDRRSNGYNLEGVTIRNAQFNTKLTMADGSQAVAYAVKYVDYNNVTGAERIDLVLENNLYMHKLADGGEPLMFIGIDGTEY